MKLYQGKKRKIDTRPYNDWLVGRLIFMPRCVKPLKAAMIVVRRIQREWKSDAHQD